MSLQSVVNHPPRLGLPVQGEPVPQPVAQPGVQGLDSAAKQARAAAALANLQDYLHSKPHLVWRASDLGASTERVCASGFPELDAMLPGGGWPTRAVTEILPSQAASLEWRLLAPVLVRALPVLVIAPPQVPFAPGLAALGIAPEQLIWVRAERPAQATWALEQALQCTGLGAVVAWLPQVRPEHVRRLQSHAQAFDGPCFVCRPPGAQHEASAAPLRVLAQVQGAGLRVQILKRRGPVLSTSIALCALPACLLPFKEMLLAKMGCEATSLEAPTRPPPVEAPPIPVLGGQHAVVMSAAKRRRGQRTALA